MNVETDNNRGPVSFRSVNIGKEGRKSRSEFPHESGRHLILLVRWALGMFTAYTAGGLLHQLLTAGTPAEGRVAAPRSKARRTN
jgi:hypothetical protein